MPDATTTPLRRKLGVRPGMRAIVVGAPAAVRAALAPPAGAPAPRLAGAFDHIHAFVTGQAELDAVFPRLKRHLRDGGTLWVSWPKGGRAGTDLALRHVIRIGYAHGLVESKTVSVDATWSAIKFTFPRAGKRYENSYGTLSADARRRPVTRASPRASPRASRGPRGTR